MVRPTDCPLISVLICSVNDLLELSFSLPKTLEHIGNSSDFQVIVKSVPSDHHTNDFVENLSYSFSNLTLFSCPDQGLYEGLNQGLMECNGKFTIVLGSDDYFYNNPLISISSLRSILVSSENVFCFPVSYDCINNPSKCYSSFSSLPIFENIEHQGLLASTSLLQSKLFDQSFVYAADYKQYLHLRACTRSWTFYCDSFVVFSRNGISYNKTFMQKLFAHYENYRALQSVSLLYSILYPVKILYSKLLRCLFLA